ncbi:MAG: S8 family serine peptidase, partial [Bdellovibrionota bacterium]
MNVNSAQQITRGADNLVIASLNTGVNYELAEFRGRVLRDTDGTYGYDAITDKKDGMDLMDFGLGTKVASLIIGNSIGLAPNSKVLPIRVFDANGASNWEVIAKGINYALAHGAKIIEFGGGPLTNLSGAMCDALGQVDAQGALLVVPAGNDGTAQDSYPMGCEISNVVVAASSDETGKLSSFSNYGFPAVHVAAPGEKILSMGRDGALSEGTGTSMSAALTAGAAALVWSAHPEYTAQMVRKALVRGSNQTDGLRGKVLANGLLDAFGAIQADLSRVE